MGEIHSSMVLLRECASYHRPFRARLLLIPSCKQTCPSHYWTSCTRPSLQPEQKPQHCAVNALVRKQKSETHTQCMRSDSPFMSLAAKEGRFEFYFLPYIPYEPCKVQAKSKSCQEKIKQCNLNFVRNSNELMSIRLQNKRLNMTAEKFEKNNSMYYKLNLELTFLDTNS